MIYIEIITGVLAVVGVLLNNRRLIMCFPLWLVSNSLCVAVHCSTGLWAMAGRDAVFLVLVLDGWRRWKCEK